MQIQEIPVKDIRPYDNNPRKNKEAVKYVVESIKNFGFKVPIILNNEQEKEIVCGHTRWLAAKKLKMQSVPCLYADDLSEEQIKAYRLADNRVSEFAEWDATLLSNELDDILNIDMGAFGFEKMISEDVDLKEIIEDDVTEVTEDVTHMGDIWEMGGHRLMCGDSTDAQSVARLLAGEKIDLVFTDPPYGMMKESVGVLNDNLNSDDLLDFNKKWINIAILNLKSNGSFYCWGIDESLMDIYSNIIKPLIKAKKATFRNLITWDKGVGIGQLSPTSRMYVPADEKCLFIMMGKQKFSDNSDNYFEGWEPIRKYLNDEMEKCGGKKNWAAALGNQMGNHYFTKSQWCLPTEENYKKLQKFGLKYGAFKREYEDLKREHNEARCEHAVLRQEYYSTRAYFDNTHDNMNSVWHFSRTDTKERVLCGNHATPKPIVLCARAIKTSSRENEIVFDLFGGSGSTLIACEQLNRQARLMELSPHFCDVIVKRWETLTGKKAKLIRS